LSQATRPFKTVGVDVSQTVLGRNLSPFPLGVKSILVMETLPIWVDLLFNPRDGIYTCTPTCIARGAIFFLSEISSSHGPSWSWFTDKTLAIFLQQNPLHYLVEILVMQHHLVQILLMVFLVVQMVK
jgi:hypothetical protein